MTLDAFELFVDGHDVGGAEEGFHWLTAVSLMSYFCS